jgi:hypothetical protein
MLVTAARGGAARDIQGLIAFTVIAAIAYSTALAIERSRRLRK